MKQGFSFGYALSATGGVSASAGCLGQLQTKNRSSTCLVSETQEIQTFFRADESKQITT